MATDSANEIGSFRSFLAWPLLTVLGLVLYLPALGSYGPIDPTDSFFIEGARELVETNQYLLPMFNYQIWLDKPILYFWMVAACYKVLGVSAFAGRLASALSAVATGVLILQGSKPALGRARAFIASCIFLTFPLVSAIGHESLTDMPLTLFMSGALLGFYNHLRQPGRFTITAAYLALGLAFLCKGPVALVIVAAIVFLYLAAISSTDSRSAFLKDLSGKIFSLQPFYGLAIMLAINLPWYGKAAYETQGQFLTTFFITQNFGRMVGKVNHLEPFWYYIPVLLGGLFPASLILFSHPQSFVSLCKKRKINDRAQGFLFFSLVWAAFVLLLFEVIKTKLATYILPAMPPLAVLTTEMGLYWLARDRVRALWPTGVIFILAGLGGLIASVVIKAGWLQVLLVEERPLLVLTVIVGLIYLFLLLKNQVRPALALILISAFVGVGIGMPGGHIVFYREEHKPFEALILRTIQDKAQIATVVTEEPSLSYFLHRHVAVINTPAEARVYMQERAPDGSSLHYLLVPKKCLKDMEWFPPSARELAHIRKWTLFKLD